MIKLGKAVERAEEGRGDQRGCDERLKEVGFCKRKRELIRLSGTEKKKRRAATVTGDTAAAATVNASTRLLSSRGPPLFIESAGPRPPHPPPPRGLQPLTEQEVLSSRGCQNSGCFLCASGLELSAESLRYEQPPSTPQLSCGEFASVALYLTRFPSFRHGYLIGLSQLQPL